MRQIVRPTLIAAGVGLLALVFILLSTPTPSGRAVDVYLLYLGAVLLVALVVATSRTAAADGGSEFDAALVRDLPRVERPRQLERLEREVHLAETSAFYLHARFRLTLREIAAQRLRTHRGLDLDGQPSPAREALGEAAWELLREDREPPRRDARGLPLEDLRAVVDAVERI